MLYLGNILAFDNDSDWLNLGFSDDGLNRLFANLVNYGDNPHEMS